MTLLARQHLFTFPRPTLLMGIINVTPDSFSDGGRHSTTESAVNHALQLAADGADILDIGGESTRPGATPVSESEELRRVIPVIEALAGNVIQPLSVDTRKVAVARTAVNAGASIINDVEAGRADPEMAQVVAQTGAGYAVMHMQGVPETMQDNPTYPDVVAAVDAFFEERLEWLSRYGVLPEQVVLDPGIGFGKTAAHNLCLITGVTRFFRHRRPLLLGLSRKSFLGTMSGRPVHDRLGAGLALTLWAIQQGVQIFRTHDVAATSQAICAWETLERQRSLQIASETALTETPPGRQ